MSPLGAIGVLMAVARLSAGLHPFIHGAHIGVWMAQNQRFLDRVSANL